MAFFALIVYTSLIYIRPQEIFPEIYGFPIVDAAAFITIMLALITNKLDIKKLLAFPQNKLILLFLVAVTVSHLSNLYFHGALDALMTFSKIVILYLLIILLVDTPGKVKTYVVLLVFLTSLLAIQGIQQYHTGLGWGGQAPIVQKMSVDDDEFGMTRATGETSEIRRITGLGFFADPNDMALAFVMIVPFLLFSIFSDRALLTKLISFSVLLVIVYATYLTNSRGGYLALAMVLLAFIILKMKGVKSVLTGALVVLLVMIYAPTGIKSVMSIDDSAYGRIEAWSEGLQMFKSDPLFGVGMGMFTDYHTRTAHNSFVLTLAETGIVGAFFWTALFYVTIRNHLRLERVPRLEDRYHLMDISRSLLIGLIGFLSAALFLSRTYIPLPYMMIAVSVCTINFLQDENKSLQFGFDLKDITKVLLIVLAGIVFIYLMVRFLWSII